MRAGVWWNVGPRKPSFKRPRKNAARIIRRATAEDEKRHQDSGHLEREIEAYVRHSARYPFAWHVLCSPNRVAPSRFKAARRVDR